MTEERIQIEEEMERAVMQKERSEEPPVFSFEANGEEIECAQTVQGKRIGRAAQRQLGHEHRDI